MTELIIRRTKDWIEEFIIKLNICPFASVPYNNGLVDLQVSEVSIDEDFLSIFLSYLVTFIDAGNKYSNAFLILPNYSLFMDYLRLYYKCEELLKMSGTDSLVQLASFHPYYQYENTEENAPSNQRNRSPYAMIHLLRAGEVEAAIESYGDTTLISEQNIRRLNELDKDELVELIERFKIEE